MRHQEAFLKISLRSKANSTSNKNKKVIVKWRTIDKRNNSITRTWITKERQ